MKRQKGMGSRRGEKEYKPLIRTMVAPVVDLNGSSPAVVVVVMVVVMAIVLAMRS